MHAEVALRDASGASPNFALGENIAGGVDARTIRLTSPVVSNLHNVSVRSITSPADSPSIRLISEAKIHSFRIELIGKKEN